MSECELCCEHTTTVVECPYGHSICLACQGTVCPFCHPNDYVKLKDPEELEPAVATAILEVAAHPPAETVSDEEEDEEEDDEEEIRSLDPLTVFGQVTAGLALGAASVKGLCYAVYPPDHAQPAWMTWTDPNLGNWLVEGCLGLLGLSTILQCCCNISFRCVPEERLRTR